MKKSLLFVLVAISMATSLQAQEEKQPKIMKNIIKTDITSLAELRYDLNLQWEHAIDKHSSAQFGFVLHDKNFFYNRFGFSFSASYRYYFSRKKSLMRGFYISPYTRYSFGQYPNLKYLYDYQAHESILRYKGEYSNYSYMQTGLKLGYQWQIKNKWVIDANAGVNVPYDFISNSTLEIMPVLGIKLGYKF